MGKGCTKTRLEYRRSLREEGRNTHRILEAVTAGGSVGDCFDHHGVLGGVEGFVVEAARDVLVELAAVHQAERAVLNAITGLEHDGLNQ